jgi:hypothetical protein
VLWEGRTERRFAYHDPLASAGGLFCHSSCCYRPLFDYQYARARDEIVRQGAGNMKAVGPVPALLDGRYAADLPATRGVANVLSKSLVRRFWA